jgi:hypothetical protein
MGAFSFGIQRPVREAHHIPEASAEVRKTQIYASNASYVFMAQCLVKHRDNFIFVSFSYNYTTQSPYVACSPR